MYPVGSIYINATVSTNPATLLGFGTWAEFGAGKVIIGLDSADVLFDTLEETGGSKDSVVVSHTHTATSTSTVTDPTHQHSVPNNSGGAQMGMGNVSGRDYGIGFTNSVATGITVSTSTTNTASGVSGTNANVQPYITVKMWKRTA